MHRLWVTAYLYIVDSWNVRDNSRTEHKKMVYMISVHVFPIFIMFIKLC